MATRLITSAVAEATGQERREDPVLPGSGAPPATRPSPRGPVWSCSCSPSPSCSRLFDVRGLISWHVAVGALLVPPALLKVASTGWRMGRYYRGDAPYQQAGPPPMALRVLGPLVVLSTLGLLGSGILLIVLGQSAAQQNIVSFLGFGVGWLTVHQGFFVVWCGATGLHLLGRIVPALRLTVGSDRGRDLPGKARRLATVAGAAVAAAVLAVILVQADGSWADDGFGPFGHSAADEH